MGVRAIQPNDCSETVPPNSMLKWISVKHLNAMVLGVGMWVLLAAGPAAAADEPAAGTSAKLGVMPLQFTATADPDVRRQIGESLLTGLRRKGVEVVAPEEVVSAAPAAAQCDTSDCLRQVGQSVGARYLVRTRIDVVDRDYTLALELLDSKSGEVLARAGEQCDVCGLNEVGELATLQGAALAQKLDMVADRPARLRFESAPTGAKVEVDGVMVGTTPLDHELTPGDHIIVVSKPGHLPAERRLTSVGGVEERLVFDLPARSEKGRSIEPWGWALLGTGMAATGIGATLLALDERPYENDCSGTNVDVNGTCRYRLNTMAGGIAGLATGVALMGTGVGLVVSGRKKRGRQKSVELQAGTMPRGLWFRARF